MATTLMSGTAISLRVGVRRFNPRRGRNSSDRLRQDARTVRVLVLNCGSSSLKYRLVDTEREAALASGLIERVGETGMPDHASALASVLDAIDGRGLAAVAHRVVHGGARFSAPVAVDDDVLAEIRALATLAPVHNPVNALGIELARRAVPDVPHVAVFDTAFHHTLPARAYTYAVPLDWAREHGVRRYGFHGTSVAYVARAAARALDRPLAELDLIVLHLGNGASATALAKGRSVDTSMGLTPLEGLVMGARSGDVDPALVLHLRRTAGLTVEQIDRLLNERSGLVALAGDNDMRRLLARDDEAAALALDVYCYRIRKYVGAYLAALGGADAIVFTGGVGEHAAPVRARALQGLERLGIALDRHANAAGATTISPPGAAIGVLVVPTDEELEIATQAAALIRTARSSS
jgi:acetate kinase